MAPRGLHWQHPCLWFPVCLKPSRCINKRMIASWHCANFPQYWPELWYFLRSFLVEWPMRRDAIMFLWRQSNGQISSNQILGYIMENICFGRIVNELGDKLPYTNSMECHAKHILYESSITSSLLDILYKTSHGHHGVWDHRPLDYIFDSFYSGWQ